MDISKISTANNMVMADIGSTNVNSKSEPVKIEKTETKDSPSWNNNAANRRELESSVGKANKIFFKNNTHLQFKIHEETRDVIVKIIDDESGDVIKEIPPEKFVDMMAKICEVAGVFVDEKR